MIWGMVVKRGGNERCDDDGEVTRRGCADQSQMVERSAHRLSPPF